MTRQSLLVAYAHDFVSYFLTERYVEDYTIKNIVLYGSVARREATEESDIDIFVDVANPDGRLEENVRQTARNFLKSPWSERWEALHVNNRINALSGNLEEWKDLKASMLSDGIVLFGKYKPKTEGQIVALFSLDPIKPESTRVAINRKLFGFTKYEERYEGLVDKCSGEKVAPSCFIVPVEHSKDIMSFLKEKAVRFKIREFGVI